MDSAFKIVADLSDLIRKIIVSIWIRVLMFTNLKPAKYVVYLFSKSKRKRLLIWRRLKLFNIYEHLLNDIGVSLFQMMYSADKMAIN